MVSVQQLPSSSKDNKQNASSNAWWWITKTGITVNHGSGNADLHVVQTALKAAKGYLTILIDEDAELLVLALHYFMNEKGLYFTNETKQSNKETKLPYRFFVLFLWYL